MLNTAPFIILPAISNTPVFVFCDHASNRIPSNYENLGLSAADLKRHIAWDIGAENLVKHFCKAYGAGGFLAQFSRLLIDPNRALNTEGLIPETSDGSIISGNQNLSKAQIQSRIDNFYAPYHQELAAQIDAVQAQHYDPLIISVHSFTPKMANGEEREVDIGLLWKVDEDIVLRLKTEIEDVHPYRVGLNEPYSALTLNHTMDHHIITRGLRHITFEVKQDLIDTNAKVVTMGKHLTHALTRFIGS